jgi:hypothetical protein
VSSGTHELDPAALATRWSEVWPDTRPIGHEFKSGTTDGSRTWVRLHSLPNSKRYPETEDEFATVLGRHHTVLQELIDMSAKPPTALCVVFQDWSSTSTNAWPRNEWGFSDPGTVPWQSIRVEEKGDAPLWFHLRIMTIPIDDLRALDPPLRRVADDDVAGMWLAPESFEWLFHPYDGGADVIAPSVKAMQWLRREHAPWLSSHESGL